MLYLIRGSYRDVFEAFGRYLFTSSGSSTLDVELDVERAMFFGSKEECVAHRQKWLNPDTSDHEYYSQGNMAGDINKMLLTDILFQKKDGSPPDVPVVQMSFAYLDEANVNSGLFTAYQKDNKQWVTALIKDTTGSLDEREVYYLTNVEPVMLEPSDKVSIEVVAPGAMAFTDASGNPILRQKLVESYIDAVLLKNGKINLNADVMELFTQAAVDESSYEDNSGLFAELNRQGIAQALKNPVLQTLVDLDLRPTPTQITKLLQEAVVPAKKQAKTPNLFSLLKYLPAQENKKQHAQIILWLDKLNLLKFYPNNKSNPSWIDLLFERMNKGEWGANYNTENRLLLLQEFLARTQHKPRDLELQVELFQCYLHCNTDEPLTEFLFDEVKSSSEAQVCLSWLKHHATLEEIKILLRALKSVPNLATLLNQTALSQLPLARQMEIVQNSSQQQSLFYLKTLDLALSEQTINSLKQLQPWILAIKETKNQTRARDQARALLFLNDFNLLNEYESQHENSEYIRCVNLLKEENALGEKQSEIQKNITKIKPFLEEKRNKLSSLNPSLTLNNHIEALLFQCYASECSKEKLELAYRGKSAAEIQLMNILINDNFSEQECILVMNLVEKDPSLSQFFVNLKSKVKSRELFKEIILDKEKWQGVKLLADNNVGYSEQELAPLFPAFPYLLNLKSPNKSLLAVTKTLTNSKVLTASQHEFFFNNAQAPQVQEVLYKLKKLFPWHHQFDSLALKDTELGYDYRLILKTIFDSKLSDSYQRMLVKQVSASMLSNREPIFLHLKQKHYRTAVHLCQNMNTRMQMIKALRALNVPNEYIDLLMENSNRGLKFFHAVIAIERQCELIRGHLKKKDPEVKYKSVLEPEKQYRQNLYGILYDVLKNKTSVDSETPINKVELAKQKEDMLAKIEKAEEPLLKVLDIDRYPKVRICMMIIANIFSVLLTAGIANALHNKKTGSLLFFGLTTTSQEVKILGKELNEELFQPPRRR